MATVYKRGGIWYGRFQRHGRDYRPNLGAGARTDAWARLDVEIKRIDAEIARGPARVWDQAMIDLAGQLERKVKPSTLKRYAVSIAQMKPFFAGKAVAEIGRGTVAEFIDWRRGQGVTDSTIRRDLLVLNQMFHAEVFFGHAISNPVSALLEADQIREPRTKIVPPDHADIDRAIAKASAGFAALLRFLRHTGMREMEGATLRWPQVNRERREVRLETTKTGQVRIVPLTGFLAPAWDVLAAQPRALHSDYVFHHDGGKPYAHPSTLFAKVRERAGVSFRVHDLRHRFACDFLAAGGDIYALSRILGHASVKTTERFYAAFAVIDLHERIKLG